MHERAAPCAASAPRARTVVSVSSRVVVAAGGSNAKCWPRLPIVVIPAASAWTVFSSPAGVPIMKSPRWACAGAAATAAQSSSSSRGPVSLAAPAPLGRRAGSSSATGRARSGRACGRAPRGRRARSRPARARSPASRSARGARGRSEAPASRRAALVRGLERTSCAAQNAVRGDASTRVGFRVLVGGARGAGRAAREGCLRDGAALLARRVGGAGGPRGPYRDPRGQRATRVAALLPGALRGDAGLGLHVLPRGGGDYGRRPRADAHSGPGGAAVRRRPPVQLRRLRGARPPARLRPQRLRRDAARAVGVGRQAAGGELAVAGRDRGFAGERARDAWHGVREYRRRCARFAGMRDIDPVRAPGGRPLFERWGSRASTEAPSASTRRSRRPATRTACARCRSLPSDVDDTSADRQRPAADRSDRGARPGPDARRDQRVCADSSRSTRETLPDDRRRCRAATEHAMRRARSSASAASAPGPGSCCCSAATTATRCSCRPRRPAVGARAVRGPSRLREPRPAGRRGPAADAGREDILLGWVRRRPRRGARDFYVRQLWDGKGSAQIELMNPGASSSTAGSARGRWPGPTRAPATRRDREPTSVAATPSTAPSPSSPRRTPIRTSGLRGAAERLVRGLMSPRRRRARDGTGFESGSPAPYIGANAGTGDVPASPLSQGHDLLCAV